MMDPSRCNAPVPERLSGDLGAFKCRLLVGRSGTHSGKHKAHVNMQGGCKIVFFWPVKPRPVDQPPVIELPTIGSPVLNARAEYRDA